MICPMFRGGVKRASTRTTDEFDAVSYSSSKSSRGGDRSARSREVRIVTVAEQQQDECVVAVSERDFEYRGETAALHRDAGCDLQRPIVLDPALDVVEPAGAAELVQRRQDAGVCGRVPTKAVGTWRGSWIERGHRRRSSSARTYAP
jgi:hypothetical protein